MNRTLRTPFRSQARRHFLPRPILFVLLLLLGLGLSSSHAEIDGEHGMLLRVDGAIGPATVDYLSRNFDRARDEGAAVIILELDTPGGLDASMRDIIRSIVTSSTPVAIYVTPAGARATSAGTYMMYGAHVAAMAPGTNLGAATPVQMGGMPESPDDEADGDNGNAENGDDENGDSAAPRGGSAMERKMINDAVAYIRSLAELRDRNADWAEKAVREAVSIGSREALDLEVIDYIAEDVEDLLAQMDGREVKVAGGTLTLQTEGLELVRVEPDWRNEFLAIITNPNVAYILMLIGIYGIIFELANPGSIVPGVLGGIALLTALFAFQALPINYAGAALMALGIAFMIAEAFMPSFGVLGIGGVVAFALGSLLLVDSGIEAYEISFTVVMAVSLSTALVVIGIATMALRAHRRRIASGREQLLSSTAIAASDFIDGRGRVRVEGELWNAHAAASIRRGDHLRVTAMHGLELEVEPMSKTGDDPQGQVRSR
ncbi:nodulation protein NfeD [Methylonatrum kenyense]|uniref:NfeD family protein n=1 Tax=Methylonatrum kenyense TaxID=455253 RepID=UPI0020C1846B|nr:nodulation protein NfeD [Methylonatrum kenyense]MCK8515557.1 nodulation protein NfeD [Methylonatrum kenyense]